MTRAGWDPRGMIELFEALRREEKRASPQDRIGELGAAIARGRGGIRDSAQFRAIKRRLARMPSARDALASIPNGSLR